MRIAAFVYLIYVGPDIRRQIASRPVPEPNPTTMDISFLMLGAVPRLFFGIWLSKASITPGVLVIP
jgi:hypothetical protein